jgi:hypothetical protein
MTIPFLAIGNEELGKKVGTKAKCPHCKKLHKVLYGKRKEGNKWVASKMLGYVKCGKEAYIVAIDGKEMPYGR